jgi:hypothetical protein
MVTINNSATRVFPTAPGRSANRKTIHPIPSKWLRLPGVGIRMERGKGKKEERRLKKKKREF